MLNKVILMFLLVHSLMIIMIIIIDSIELLNFIFLETVGLGTLFENMNDI